MRRQLQQPWGITGAGNAAAGAARRAGTDPGTGRALALPLAAPEPPTQQPTAILWRRQSRRLGMPSGGALTGRPRHTQPRWVTATRTTTWNLTCNSHSSNQLLRPRQAPGRTLTAATPAPGNPRANTPTGDRPGTPTCWQATHERRASYAPENHEGAELLRAATQAERGMVRPTPDSTRIDSPTEKRLRPGIRSRGWTTLAMLVGLRTRLAAAHKSTVIWHHHWRPLLLAVVRLRSWPAAARHQLQHRRRQLRTQTRIRRWQVLGEGVIRSAAIAALHDRRQVRRCIRQLIHDGERVYRFWYGFVFLPHADDRLPPELPQYTAGWSTSRLQIEGTFQCTTERVLRTLDNLCASTRPIECNQQQWDVLLEATLIKRIRPMRRDIALKANALTRLRPGVTLSDLPPLDHPDRRHRRGPKMHALYQNKDCATVDGSPESLRPRLCSRFRHHSTNIRGAANRPLWELPSTRNRTTLSIRRRRRRRMRRRTDRYPWKSTLTPMDHMDSFVQAPLAGTLARRPARLYSLTTRPVNTRTVLVQLGRKRTPNRRPAGLCSPATWPVSTGTALVQLRR